MNREEAYARLKGVFQDVFGREIDLSDETTAADVPGWDSLSHITLIGCIEDEFGVEFAMSEIAHIAKIGDLVALVLGKLG